MSDILVITCEHAGNRIPSRYLPLFESHQATLQSHLGYDIGALSLARHMAGALDAPLFYSVVSRLLIDVNRSIGHPRLYSEATRGVSQTVRQEVLKRYYLPYRSKVENRIAQSITPGQRVIHISCHSFTPELGGKVRNADVGFLYDPARAGELRFSRDWQAQLLQQARDLKVRLNYPYAGNDNGFTCTLRKRFAPEQYLGIELEVNQRTLMPSGHWREVRRNIVKALCDAVEGRSSTG